jgi:hypothetical protein
VNREISQVLCLAKSEYSCTVTKSHGNIDDCRKILACIDANFEGRYGKIS